MDTLVVTRRESRLDELSLSLNIPTEYFTNRESFFTILQQTNFQTLYSAGCPYVLPQEILTAPNKKFLNAHPSLLPHYPGVHSITEAMYNGGPYGVTIHTMGKEVDTGRLIAQKQLFMHQDLSAMEIFETMFYEEEKLIEDSLAEGFLFYENDSSLPAIPTSSGIATFKRDSNFRKIENWMTVNEIAKRVKILNVRNHYAYLEDSGQKIYISKCSFNFKETPQNGKEKTVIFKAKDGTILLYQK